MAQRARPRSTATTVQSPIGRRILGAFTVILALITANGLINYLLFENITAAKLEERRRSDEKVVLDHISFVLATQIAVYDGAVWANGTLPNNFSSQQDPYTGAITGDINTLNRQDAALFKAGGPLANFVNQYNKLQDLLHTFTGQLVRSSNRDLLKVQWRANADLINNTPTMMDTYRRAVATDLVALTQRQDAAGQTALNTSLLVAVLSLALALALALGLTRGIVRPVALLKRTLQQVAEGDLSPRPPAQGRDEIGDVLTTLNTTLARLRTLLAAIQAQALTISNESGQLQAQAQTAGTRTAQEAASVQEALRTIDELSDTAGRIAVSAADVAHSTSEVQTAVSDSRRVVQATTDEMIHVRDRVQAISAGILALADRTHAIENVLEFMGQIAGETHLLALNAAIEAAGAGPYGVRFTVIAGEVQELATQANSASEQIIRLVDDIRTAMEQAVSIGNAGVAEVDRGMETVCDLERVHTRIEQLVGRTRDLAYEISTATQQQRDGSRAVADTVSALAQTSRENEDQSRRTVTSATNLTAVAQYLRDAADQFRLGA